MAQARSRWLALIGILISAGAIGWLVYSYDAADLGRSLGSASYAPLLVAIPLVVLDYLLRALRWRTLLAPARPPLGTVFRALMLGYLFNVLLPARAGELVRVHRLGVDAGIPRGAVLGTVVAERTGDLVALIGLLAVLLVVYPALPNWVQHAGWVIALIACGALSVLAALASGGPRLVAFAAAGIRRLSPAAWADRLEPTLHTFVAGCVTLLAPRVALTFLLSTTLLWLLEVAIAHQAAAALGLSIAPGNLLFVLLVIAAGTLVPSSPGFIGTFEFFGTAALEMVGVRGPEALSFVVLLHAIALLVPLILGASCLIAPRAGAARPVDGARESKR